MKLQQLTKAVRDVLCPALHRSRVVMFRDSLHAHCDFQITDLRQMNDDFHSIHGAGLTACIKAEGAELCSLTHAGTEFIWQAGPAWPRHAPLLFPIVGRLKDDELKHRGRTYQMTQHGFARDLTFDWLERSRDRCSLALSDSAETLLRYPFAFRLVVTYGLDASGLAITLAISNPGTEMLPASIGGHPAFNWPLASGLAKTSYALTFFEDEPHPIRRLDGGLLRSGSEPSPLHGRRLELTEQLFSADAVIFDRLRSNRVRYDAGRGPWMEMSWSGFRELGVWSKPGGASFVCIEPWRGYASPTAFDGEFIDKPGLMHIAPGASEVLSFRIRVGSDDGG